jgi:hypothetical protein
MNYILPHEDSHEDSSADDLDSTDETFVLNSKYAPAKLKDDTYISSRSRNNMERKMIKIILEENKKRMITHRQSSYMRHSNGELDDA